LSSFNIFLHIFSSLSSLNLYPYIFLKLLSSS
jgi:hypothetical protein